MAELMDDSRTIDVALSTPRPSSCMAPDGIGYGDIDGDGFVTAADADYLAKHVAGIAGYPLSAAQAIRADVNGDGKVDARDVAWIAKFVNHVSGYDVFPVCAATGPAKGQLVDMDFPESAVKGKTFDVDASVKNIGESSGTFRVDMYINNKRQHSHLPFVLAPGETSTDKIDAKNTPSEGLTMTLRVECVRIT